ncbi:MAG TPA: CBS domain-containing protein [Verrucomicrobiae bacterium]|nr:CBS domain-containing protein [Verrucomicrobiae bacterium]
MARVEEIMTKNPACCGAGDGLQVVARQMCEADCGEIPVLDEDLRPMGVLTDRDITCRTVARGLNPLELTAGECMTPHCVTVGRGATIEECCALMEEHQVRRLPVVDDKGRCCGIVSQADIAFEGPDKIAELVQEVSRSA